MTMSLRNTSNGPRRGSALMAAVVLTLLLAGMSSALLSFGTSATRESVASAASTRALYLAEAGIHDALMRFTAAAADERIQPPTELGSYDMPLKMGAGDYYVDIVDAGDTVTLTSYAMADGVQRAVEVVLQVPQGGVYNSALFAGNSSGDPTYSLDLGGEGGQADEIDGDIYSAGDVVIWGDAEVDGEIMAGGSIEGASGQEGYTQPIPDIAAMDYENNNDVNVLDEFLMGSRYRYDRLGGYAYQLPEANPAHIFRVNPSDRRSDYRSTEKHDFFLEDPYEPVRVDRNQNGRDACPITLSGTMGRPGPDGTDLVYYIDGNLWVHNKRTYSFKFFNQQNESTKVTFVVKGNVYFSDNLFYLNNNKDGIAFIAITDEDVEDSGNIYFGDPVFGTLEHMSAFMYAQNNFYDNNLSASGSAEVTVVGNMTAGNQVAINRDWGDQHSKLEVIFDDRINSGELEMPGLPASTWGDEEYTVISWREVPPRQQP